MYATAILRRGALVAAFGALAVQPAAAGTIISEVFYDASGADGGHTFIELYGTPGSSLDGLTLEGVNGGDGSVYRTIALSGALPADGVFVIGDDGGGGSTSVPGADMVADADLQNGPDSLVLKDGATVLDAVGYGDFSSAVFAGEGNAAPDAPAGSSLARGPGLADTGDNLADFMVLATPTPGIVPAVAAVPLPGALWLFGAGLALLSTRRRRVPVWAAAGT